MERIEINLDPDDFCKCETPVIGERFDNDYIKLQPYCKICGKNMPIDFDICKCEKPIIGKKYKNNFVQDYCKKCGKDIKDGLHWYDETRDEGYWYS